MYPSTEIFVAENFIIFFTSDLDVDIQLSTCVRTENLSEPVITVSEPRWELDLVESAIVVAVTWISRVPVSSRNLSCKSAIQKPPVPGGFVSSHVKDLRPAWQALKRARQGLDHVSS